MKAKKVTEGEGYVSGDHECWCIHDVPFEEWNNRKYNGLLNDSDEPPESIYPSDFFPECTLFDKDGFDYSKKIRYKITVEIEHI